ncbi:DNA repair protein RecN [Desulfatirhabdium butyrativorans]|uniref:DNA repair protein RecN n=1 Tax=Desulfatirhabdium butyrativorans TaxID=340467 RepID=UPI0003FEC51D|nr:DNA repair protein RecN [Desulfatirhabdium butyrativorans]
MLRELTIKNFAIIDDLHIEFNEGLTVLTGETGAGKSIVVQAVNLLLGARADASMVRSGCSAAELEAFFEIPEACPAASILLENDIDPGEGLVVRRVVSESNRHKITMNGRTVTGQMLQAVTGHLAGISGQHAHQRLLREDHHLLLLDAFCGLHAERQELTRLYHVLMPLLREHGAILDLQRRQAALAEVLEAERHEIREASVQTGEDQVLESERAILKHREFLVQALQEGMQELYSRDGSILERLVALSKILEKAGRIDPESARIGQRIQEARILVEDIAGDVRGRLGGLEMDEGRLEAIEKRLDALNRLKRKYGGSLDAVQQRLEQVQHELASLEDLDNNRRTIETRIAALKEKMTALAQRLSAERTKGAVQLTSRMVQELAELRMGSARFAVRVAPADPEPGDSGPATREDKRMRETGWDTVSFWIATNEGEELKPLARIASGGELSRVVLAIHAIMAQADAVSTIVFDEVDAGIGGRTADVVGRKLHELAKRHQLICITHLPQIARFGQHHFHIAKRVAGNRTVTTIEALDAEKRVIEMARMLGGEHMTETTLAHARELLETA